MYKDEDHMKFYMNKSEQWGIVDWFTYAHHYPRVMHGE